MKKFEQVFSLGHQMSPGGGWDWGPVQGVRVLHRGGQGPVQRGSGSCTERGQMHYG